MSRLIKEQYQADQKGDDQYIVMSNTVDELTAQELVHAYTGLKDACKDMQETLDHLDEHNDNVAKKITAQMDELKKKYEAAMVDLNDELANLPKEKEQIRERLTIQLENHERRRDALYAVYPKAALHAKIEQKQDERSGVDS